MEGRRLDVAGARGKGNRSIRDHPGQRHSSPTAAL